MVGRERVIASSDCGFGTFAGFGKIDPDIAYAKLRTLAEGAAIASRRLWDDSELDTAVKMADLKIVEVTAYPTSFPVPEANRLTLGIGRVVKRDAVVVKVTTDGGLVGWGESHHARCPGAVAHLVNTSLRQIVIGRDAADVVGVWQAIYARQLASHGMFSGCAMAMSGIDQALWDIRGKAVGWPLYRLLGGSSKPVPAYAGGVSLGYQAPQSLVEEARPYVETRL